MVEFDHVRPPESFSDLESAEAYYLAVRADAEVRRARAAEKHAEIAEREHEENDEFAEIFEPFVEKVLSEAEDDLEEL